MANTIKPKRSNTASKVPNTSELVSGELGVNMADRKVYINNGTTVVQVGAGLLSALGDVTITSPTNGQSLSYDGTAWVNATGAGTGTVTSVSVVSANGLAGTVATATSTPAITLSTTITGLLKGNATAISAAVSGTDYAPATSGSSILYGNGAGGFSAVTVGTGLSFTTGTLSATNAGTVTSVTATSPVASTGGATPVISMPAATTTVSGYLTSTDWNTFNGKYSVGGALGTPSSGTLTNCTFPTLNQNTTGSSGSCTGNAATATTATYWGNTTFPTGNNQDFNSVTTGGIYNIVWGNYSGTLNTPPAANSYGTLEVQAGANFITQIYYPHSTNTSPCIRIYYNGSWFAWIVSLTSANYTAYAPSLTGSGASGNWGINVTGSSASCTGNAATATTATNFVGIPAGTVMLFIQTSAPTGWTKSTTHDNKALRIVSGTASSGGSVAFTTAFASQSVTGSVAATAAATATNQATTAGGSISVTVGAGTLAVGAGTFAVGATTLATTQIPSHSHTYSIAGDQKGNNIARGTAAAVAATPSTSSTGGGTSHTHGLTGAPSISGSPSVTAQSFTGTSHNHTQDAHSHTSGAFTGNAINLAVSYVDAIIATKN